MAEDTRDQTERRQPPPLSEERIRAALESSPVVLFAQDRDLRYTWYYNPHEGLSEVELLGKTDAELLPADDAAHLTAIKRQVLESGVPGRAEVRTTIGGKPYYYELTMKPIRDADNRITGITCVSIDITERKRSEVELQERERLLEEAQRLGRVGSWEWDLATDSMKWTRGQYALFGLEPEKFVPTGSRLLPLVHPDDHPLVMEKIAHIVSTGTFAEFDHRIAFSDGSTRVLRAKGAITGFDSNGQPSVMAGVNQDITERKRAEEELRRSEELFRSYFELPLVGIAVTSLEKGWLQVNDRLCEILGYPREELIRMTWEEITHPDDAAADLEYYNRILSGEIDGGSMEKRFVRKDGRNITAAVSVRCVRKAGGAIDYFVTVLQDITEERLLEAQLQQAQKLESVGRLAGGVAHDFNNMLAVILGHVDMAIKRIEPGHRVQVNLEQIREAALRSAELARQLLAFARKETVAPRAIDLNDTVSGMTAMLQRLIGEDIEIRWQPGADLWPVRIDPSQLNQILANLSVNARDAIRGEGRISIETANVVLDEAGSAAEPGSGPGPYVRISVSDNGCGMDQGTLARIFEPFFTTKEGGRGTGLGLATVYGAVKQNNGFIRVRSEPGQGARFDIYLPRHTGEVARAEAVVLPGPAARGVETILLVEDNPSVLETAGGMLREEGYTVLAARTPAEALRLARERAGGIHLLLTDVIMPEMNGQDLASGVLAHSPRVRCLFMSGYPDEVIAHHGMLDEGVCFIQKPFTMEALAAKVREALTGCSKK